MGVWTKAAGVIVVVVDGVDAAFETTDAVGDVDDVEDMLQIT